MGVCAQCLAEHNRRKYHKTLLETTFISSPLVTYRLFFFFSFFGAIGKETRKPVEESAPGSKVWDRRKCSEPWAPPSSWWLCAKLQVTPAPGSQGPKGTEASEKQPSPQSSWAQSTEYQVKDLLNFQGPPWGCPRNAQGISCLQAVWPLSHKTQHIRFPTHRRDSPLSSASTPSSGPCSEPQAQESANHRQVGLPRPAIPTPHPAAKVALPTNRLHCQPEDLLGETQVSLSMT